MTFVKAHWAWLPIHDLNKEGLWEQAKSKKPLVYHNWAVGEPNQNGDEDCGAMAADGLWNDLSCDLFLPAVCQRGVSKHSCLLSATDIQHKQRVGIFI